MDAAKSVDETEEIASLYMIVSHVVSFHHQTNQETVAPIRKSVEIGLLCHVASVEH
jgi:hypothetical protein